jgi:hypothetical protein
MSLKAPPSFISTKQEKSFQGEVKDTVEEKSRKGS